MTMLEAVRTYQVPGSVNIFDPETSPMEHGWADHCPGTAMSSDRGLHAVYLGMPAGFNRLGPLKHEHCRIRIFESMEDLAETWKYDMFNVPVWKHVDCHGNTLVRGFCPRNNTPFLHVILGNHAEEIDCLEITAADIAEMDY